MPNHELDKQLHNPPEGIDPTQEIRVKFEEGRYKYADVPLFLIEDPGIPVDHEHVEELAKQMLQYKREDDVEGGNGQEEDVMLAQIDDDPEKLHITEGLHRVSSLTLNGEGYVRAKILMNSSMEEVVRKRMSGVKEHPSIRTSRAVTMIDELWQFTPWSEKLTSSQAFSLTNDDRSGKELRISGEEAKGIKQWAQERAEECNLSVATVDKHLRLIDAVDPEIIKNAREMHGKQDSPYFASANLKWLAKHLRGEFDKQKLVVEIATAKNMSSPQVEKLAMTIAGFDDLDEARGYIESDEFASEARTKEPIKKPSTNKAGPSVESKPQPTPAKSSSTAKSPEVNGAKTEIQPMKIIPARGVKEKKALDLAKEIIVSEVIPGTYHDMVDFVKSGRYVCIPNQALEQPYFVTDKVKEGDDNSRYSADIKKWGQIMQGFKLWTSDERIELKDRLEARRTLIDKLSKKQIDGIRPDRSETTKAFEVAIERVVRDTKIGALKYVKDIDSENIGSIFINCLLDQLHAQIDPRRQAKVQTNRTNPKFLRFNDLLLCCQKKEV